MFILTGRDSIWIKRKLNICKKFQWRLTAFNRNNLYYHSTKNTILYFTYINQNLDCILRSWVRIPPGAWIFVCCECRVLSGRGLCDELITRPEECYRLCCVVVCDLETSRMGATYIYDISSLKVNNLTLILLTRRKWWAPNNASK